MNLNNVFHVPDRSDAPHRAVSFVLPENMAGIVKLGNLPAAPVEWLWAGRIPIGRVTLLVGDSGLGKSLVTLEVAARVTRGDPLPGEAVRAQPSDPARQPPRGTQILGRPGVNPFARAGSPTRHANPRQSRGLAANRAPASVVLLTAEDDLADTVRPRLEALDADCDRIFAIPFVAQFEDDEDHTPAAILRRDLKRLRHLLDALPDCRLLIVDPVSAYLGGSENSGSQVRSLLGPLATLARERRLAVLAVSHLRKKEGLAIYRANGSLSLVNSSRAVWLVTRDPADANRRLMLPVKSNLAADDAGIGFTIQASGIGGPPVIQWSPTTPRTAKHVDVTHPVGRPNYERCDAARWLTTFLTDGARPSAQIEEEAAAHGIRIATLRRAFRDLGGEAVRVGFGPLGEWFWRIPGLGNQNPKPTFDHLWKNLAENLPKTEARV